jgi:methylated-DNA-[protein]-cysteine S-methyltransferase
MRWAVFSTPIGHLSVAIAAATVCRVHFGRHEGPAAAADDTVLAAAEAQLREYLAGRRTEFDLPLAGDVGGSAFERAVWAAIASIPYGEMRTYGQIATEVGDPSAARAVGVACNRNPLPVVVACHRVVGADGKLVGFGGGLPRKRFLLELEARVRVERDFAI